MRILADENCPGDLVHTLEERGHDVVWIRTDSPGVKDPHILNRAQAEEHIVLTFDKDFGESAFRQQLPAQSGIILCRLHGLPPARLISIVLAALDTQPSWIGSFTVITEQRIRILPLLSG